MWREVSGYTPLKDHAASRKGRTRIEFYTWTLPYPWYSGGSTTPPIVLTPHHKHTDNNWEFLRHGCSTGLYIFRSEFSNMKSSEYMVCFLTISYSQNSVPCSGLLNIAQRGGTSLSTSSKVYCCCPPGKPFVSSPFHLLNTIFFQKGGAEGKLCRGNSDCWRMPWPQVCSLVGSLIVNSCFASCLVQKWLIFDFPRTLAFCQKIFCFCWSPVPHQTGTMGLGRTWLRRKDSVGILERSWKEMTTWTTSRVMDIGGVPYLMPSVQRERL